MKQLWLDTETFCAVPITHGTHAYAEEAEIMLVPYAVDDGPVGVIDLTDPADGRTLADVQALIDAADEIIIQNSAFDRTVARHRGLNIPLEKIHDTMVRALMHSLPGSLEALCEVLNVPQYMAKLKTGKKLIYLFTKPLGKNRKLDRATRLTHPEEWEDFKEYAGFDVVSMREVYKRLPTWNYKPSEIALWQLDQRVNDRGIAVDLDLAHAALRAAQRAGASLAARADALTGGAVKNTTQRGKTLEHLRALGLETDDLKGATIDTLLKRDDLSKDVRELLQIRSEASATSPAKYRTLLHGTSRDSRLRGTLQFCGASRTGRWGGRLFQPQNLPRPTLKQKDIEAGITAMKADIEDALYPDVMELCASAVRGCLVAGPGKKLVVADLSNIEGRMLAFLADETWKLEAFSAFDKGVGHDLYALAYAKAFNVSPETVMQNKKTGDGTMRQIGKVMELMLGYEGGVGAFITGAETYKFNIEEMAANAIKLLPQDARERAESTLEWRKEKGMSTYNLSDTAFVVCEAFKALWRKAHPRTTSLWKAAEVAAIDAVQNPGRSFNVGKLSFRCDNTTLRMILPNKRSLCYPQAEVVGGLKTCATCKGSGKVLVGGFAEDGGRPAEYAICKSCLGAGAHDFGPKKLSYMGIDQYTRKWTRLSTYGGKLIENATQAASRDAFAHGMKAAEAAGYLVVLHVHDELLTETPDTPEWTAEGLAEIMASGPLWAFGLPLAAAGFTCHRYRKE